MFTGLLVIGGWWEYCEDKTRN
uniref:Uncharacterized protein n=1 Tax=Rhizophora mucronata TaxID=61149 RepID=A0A2P2Q7L7_RHIMU